MDSFRDPAIIDIRRNILHIHISPSSGLSSRPAVLGLADPFSSLSYRGRFEQNQVSTQYKNIKHKNNHLLRPLPILRRRTPIAPLLLIPLILFKLKANFLLHLLIIPALCKINPIQSAVLVLNRIRGINQDGFSPLHRV